MVIVPWAGVMPVVQFEVADLPGVILITQEALGSNIVSQVEELIVVPGGSPKKVTDTLLAAMIALLVKVICLSLPLNALLVWTHPGVVGWQLTERANSETLAVMLLVVGFMIMLVGVVSFTENKQ
jgi:hypothetical protein